MGEEIEHLPNVSSVAMREEQRVLGALDLEEKRGNVVARARAQALGLL